MNPISSKPKRACLYLRTSTVEQHVENQRPVLEDLARRRGFDVVAVFEEQASAVKKRPIFEQVMADAHAGKFDVLCIWALDRMGRSMTGNLQAVLDLDCWRSALMHLPGARSRRLRDGRRDRGKLPTIIDADWARSPADG